jgi:hypothetical protein
MKSAATNDDVFLSQSHDLLVAEGYRLVEDAWDEFGRRTYLHEDDANRDYIKGLGRLLQSAGWQSDSRKLRTFHHPGSDHEIELEPGGSEVTGHFLHHMRPKQSGICGRHASRPQKPSP